MTIIPLSNAWPPFNLLQQNLAAMEDTTTPVAATLASRYSLSTTLRSIHRFYHLTNIQPQAPTSTATPSGTSGLASHSRALAASSRTTPTSPTPTSRYHLAGTNGSAALAPLHLRYQNRYKMFSVSTI